MKKIQIGVFIGTLFLMSFITLSPLFRDAYFPMHDNTQPTRIYEMNQALLDGQFPVRWVKDLGYGYGYPIFNFYAPLPYYLGGLIMMVGFDPIDSSKILFGIATVGSFLTMYIFLRRFIGQLPATAGAMIYTLFPYHAINTYVRGALSEQFGYLIIPLIFMALLKLLSKSSEKKSFYWALLLGLFGGLLILSHNLSALMCAIVLVPVVIGGVFYTKNKKLLLGYIFFAGTIAIGLSAFYLVPMVFESSYTNVSSQVGGGADFRDHFVCFGQLWSGGWGFGGSTQGCVDGMSFRLGKVNVLLFVVSVFYVCYQIAVTKRVKDFNIFYIGIYIVLFSLWLMLSISRSLWESIDVLEYIQYPWRFLSFVGLGISMVIGFGLGKFQELMSKSFIPLIVFGSICLLTLLNNAKLFSPQDFVVKDLAHYISEESIRYDISKISDEYMPQNFQKPESRVDVPKSIVNTSGDVSITNEYSDSNKKSFVMKSMHDEKVILNIAPYPSWKIIVDGNEIIAKATSRGYRIDLPVGEHVVEAQFIQTNAQIVGNAITIIVIFGIGAVIMKKIYGKKTP